MEETSSLFDERNAEVLSGVENGLVVLATTWRGNVLNARAGRSEDVVDEGELRIRLALLFRKRERNKK